MKLPAARSPHRAWIEIDHEALVGNLAALRRLAGEGRSVQRWLEAHEYPEKYTPVEKERIQPRNAEENAPARRRDWKEAVKR